MSEIASAGQVVGRPVSQADDQIAAIARSRGMAVATHNTRDFKDMGIDIFKPLGQRMNETTEPRMPLVRVGSTF